MKKSLLLITLFLCSLFAVAQTLPEWTSTNTTDSSTSSNTYILALSSAGSLSFNWSVSSESGYDWLVVTLDGSELLKKSGEQSGTYDHTFTAGGSHTLVVKYTKDGSASRGNDKATISNITLTVQETPSAPAGKKGDVNNDGVVNVGDVTSLVDVILYGDEEEPDTPTITTGEAIDLGLSVKWASCNVGASTPEEYGGYYAWGETEEKNDYSWSTYKYCNGNEYSMTKYCTGSYNGTVDNKTILEPGDDVAHVQWGGSWRMPTLEEQKELINNCTWSWTTLNGVNGYRVIGPNGNSIFLPAAGRRSGEDVYHQGANGYYWSSTWYIYDNCACSLYFYSGGYDWDDGSRCYGQSVRPVSE